MFVILPGIEARRSADIYNAAILCSRSLFFAVFATLPQLSEAVFAVIFR
jgi:hypothetical protein